MLRPPRSGEDNARGAGCWLLLVLLGAAVSGCASEGVPTPAPPPAWTDALSRSADALEAELRALPTAPPGTVVVHLAFDPEADLDLYVSDPFQETIYYANTPARTSGGRLLADRRCQEPGQRVETVRFDHPPAGRYRVGVDYPHRCRDDAEVVAYAVAIDANGKRHIVRGLARPVVFTPIVAEFSAGEAEPAQKPPVK